MSIVFNSNNVIKELENSKKNIKKENNNIVFAKKYLENGLIPFTLNICTKKDGKKDLKGVPKFSEIDKNNCINKINKNTNGMAIRMGCKYLDEDYFIVLLDIDTKDDKENNIWSGMTKWNELMEGKKELVTPTQRTGNNGLHYLFKVSEDIFIKLPKSITEMSIDGKMYSIDFKGENQFALVEPSKYDDKIYKWIIDFSEDIMEMPKWILSILLKQKDRNKIKNSKKTKILNCEPENKNLNVMEQNAISKKNDLSYMINSKQKSETRAVSMFKRKINNEASEKHTNEYLNEDQSEHSHEHLNENICEQMDENLNEQIIEDLMSSLPHSSPFKKEILTQILDGFDVDMKICDKYDTWTMVGMALKNESNSDEFFELWNNWSKKSKAYCGINECKKKWRGYKNLKNTLGPKFTIKTLLDELKNCNYEEYKKIYPKFVVANLMDEHKKLYYTNNKCNIDKIVSTDNEYNVIIYDAYCPNHKGEHSNDDPQSHRIYAVTISGKAYMMCTNKICFGKICPKNAISLKPHIINNIFFTQNNNFVINNNYGVNKWIHNVKIFLRNYVIFEDETINKLMIESIENDIGVANAIVQIFYDKIYFVNNIWYYFDDRWKQNDSLCNIMGEFVIMYETIEKFISNSEDILLVEKYDYLDQIAQNKNNITNEKKNKNIVAHLKLKVKKDIVFDSYKNLFAFNNGVYDFDKMEFRQILTMDLITKSCNYDYSENYTDKDNLMKVLSNMFPDNKSMECFLTYVALGISGKYNFDVLMILQWGEKNVRHRQILINLINSAFNDYNYYIQNIATNNKKISSSLFPNSTRLALVELSKDNSQKDICPLIDRKTILSEDNNNNFCILCMSDDILNIGEELTDNVGYIIMSEKKYEQTQICVNDFILLLIERLKLFVNYDIFNDIKYKKYDNRTIQEKLCDDFLQNCVVNSEKGFENKDKCKCVDIYQKYLEWRNIKDIKLTKIEFYKELKKKYIFKKSINFKDGFTSGFYGFSLI